MAGRAAANFDELAQQYFSSPESFAKGLKLLQRLKRLERKYPNFADRR
jgi:hypothetical protein